jgi:hypothetical protein
MLVFRLTSLAAVQRQVSRLINMPEKITNGIPVASVDESASIAEFHHVTKVHVMAVWDYLYHGIMSKL